MTLRIDYSFALDEGSSCGLKDARLDQEAARIDAAVKAVRARFESGELGFRALVDGAEVLASIDEFVTMQCDQISDVLVLGIGGSSLGGRTILDALAPQPARRVHFLDNSDPTRLAQALDQLEPSSTLAITMSKSGGTIETAAQMLIVREWMGDRASQHMVAVTDPENGSLRALANAEGLTTFPIPSNVGGRFSVLTAVGLLPARLAGIDAGEMLAGARAMATRCEQGFRDNPAAIVAALHVLHHQEHGRLLHVLMPYSDPLRAFANWFVQLWAESLGKRVARDGQVIETGPTPIPSVGATDQHAQVQLFMEGPRDKLVSFVVVDELARDLPIPQNELPGYEYLSGHSLGEILSAEQRATAAALAEDRRPSLTIHLPKLTPNALGELFFLFEMATAIAGELYDIDAFNQPGVEAGKRFAYGLLGRPGHEEAAEQVRARQNSPKRVC